MTDFKEKIEDMDFNEILTICKDSYAKKMPGIITIPYIGVTEKVKYTFGELTALCPMTGLPDQYTITVTISPQNLLPELKSLKMYYISYRNLPISHEHLLSKIYTDILKTVNPIYLIVELDVAIRGGIKTIIRKDSREDE
ncbi:MAG: 7-cyano-7-deazaguanine reductase [Methanobacterium sp. PtaU1.Bin097]|nr:MAG: 7-cyano-7-deazaguanine reductase [Methanobacterium sp. PtaU1.Bin097]